MNCKELKRLTTDNPKGNFDRLMNYAYAKNNRTHLSYAGGKYDVDLCEYVSDLAKAKGYDFSPEFIMEDGLFDNCDDDFAILYYCAVQAAELRARLKLYEDKLENGMLIELPCKVGDTVYVINRAGKPQKMILDEPDIRCHCVDEDNLCMALCSDKNNNICAYRFRNDNSDIGKKVFLTREEAEKVLEGLENGS